MVWRHADRVRQAVLLGSFDSKRYSYLKRAAQAEGLLLSFVDWRDWEALRERQEAEILLKIDPPQWESCSLEELDGIIRDYLRRLQGLASIGARGAEFFNTPSVIAALLDKRACNETLKRAGIPVTEQLTGKSDAGKRTVQELLEMMRERKIYQVFIKPENGSGAAGVTAFRWHPASGRMVLYTCAFIKPDGGFVNTKRLRRFSEPSEILAFLERLLSLGCTVERWYAKAEHQGFSYDLRAVVQDGCLDFLLGRLSRGPITNLHLNNHPLPAEELGLPEHVMEDIAELCQRSATCYPGLKSVGIDILLEKGSLKPRVIEMNAQGDLIYQDIYHENVIYRHQARMMKAWLHEAARK